MEENYNEEDSCSQEDYYEYAGTMYELIRQFIVGLDGNESKETLETLITQEAEMIHEQVPVIPVDAIIQEIRFRIEK